MSIGDLSKFLSEGNIVDHNWLKVNPKEYDNSRFNDIPEYVAIPKLVEEWKHLRDKNINLVPNVDLNYNYKTPDKMEEEVKTLIDLIKKELMVGKKGKEIVEYIKNKTTPKVLKASKEYLEKISQEQGLLGNVYIDPSAFKNCKEGNKILGNKTKLAKYALKMSKCSDCICNRDERCEVYKKILTSEVKYDQNLFNFYSTHLKELRKDYDIDSKESLKKAFLKVDTEKTRFAEFKPVDMSPEITLAKKEETFEDQLKKLKDDLSKIKVSKIASDLSECLIKGYSSNELKTYITNKYSKEDLKEDKVQDILEKQGSLGSVFVESDNLPFKNCIEAKSSFRTNKASYIINTNNFCKCGSQSTCHNLNKKIVANINDIPDFYWKNEFNKYPEIIRNKLASIYNENPIKALRIAFLSKDIYKWTDKVNTSEYNLKESVDHYDIGIKDNRVYASEQGIKKALELGYPLSRIVYTLKKGCVDAPDIITKIENVLKQIPELNKYQLDIAVVVPENLKLKTTDKDINLDFKNPTTEIPDFVNSLNAPYDSSIKEYNINETPMNKIDFVERKPDLEISGLNEFNI